MVVAINRAASVNVDLSAIAENIKNELNRMDEKTEMFAVVKANAYGHGAVEVANVARKNGVTGFCVAVFDEALELRNAGFDEPILVLGITSPKLVKDAIKNDISLTVGSLSWLKEAATILGEDGTLKIHLAIDSGMGRIGFIETDEFKQAVNFLERAVQKQFLVEGIFTHFASADSADDTYFKYQVGRFNKLLAELRERPRYVHVANSATSLFHEACHSDLIRFGIAMYGLNPSSAPKSTDLITPFELKPALSLISELVFVKKITKGMGVSYGSTYIAEGDEWIGTVPLGYADGWQRGLQGFQIKVGDVFCPIVGRICMDQFMVKLPHEIPVGTKVELIAANNTATNSIHAVADYLQTIHYEVACLLSTRLPRVYLK